MIKTSLKLLLGLLFTFCLIFPNILFAQYGSIFTDDKKAREVFASGNFREAIKHLNELLKVNKNHKEYNALIGYAYLMTNIDKSKAIEHFERAIQNRNHDPYIYFDLGKAYMLCYQFDEAIKNFNIFMQKVSKEDEGDLPAQRYIEMCENAKILIPLRVNATIQNLGEEVNSKFPDFNPYIDENESVLYFTTKRDKNSPAVRDIDGFKTADIYVAEYNGTTWDKVKRLPNTINSAYIEEIVGLSADGETMLIYANNEHAIDDIFISTKKKKNFQRSEKLGFTINSEFQQNGAMISPDGNWLFFSSNIPGGYGGFDIYYARKLPNGDWSQPFNAGNMINTEYDDNFPYIAPDGTTFYFSSQGHNSMGGYDLFQSQWDENTLSFSPPENLGFPINTPDDNKTISVTKSGRYAYISDFRENGIGDLDIYKVTFLDVPPPYHVIKATLFGKDSLQLDLKNRQNDYKIIIRDAGTKKMIGTYRPNYHNQRFSIALHPGFYLFSLFKNDEEDQSFEFILPDRESLNENIDLPTYLKKE